MGWTSRFSYFSTAFSFLAIGVIISPETFVSKSQGKHLDPKLVAFLKLIHLLSFSSAWGVTLWVVILGIIWFRNLPRHLFGNLRSKMFPACFSFAGPCSAVSAATFAYLRHPWMTASPTHKYQLGYVVAAFALNLLNQVVLTPMTLEMMKQRHRIEKEAKIGEEIGWAKNREVAKVNPELAAMNKRFNRIHGLSALALVLYFGSLSMHFWYLAGQLNF